MSGDIITPKDLELSALRAWKERALEAERKLLDYEGQPMLFSGRTELAAFKKREPRVAEVCNAFIEFAWATSGPAPNPHQERLVEALRRLVEWSPT